MKKFLLAMLFLVLSSVQCQTKDTTIVINIFTNDTLNICLDDTLFVHYIINRIPLDTVCTPVIVSDTTETIAWWSFEIDSTYLSVRLPDGTLPKRESGTYKYWKADSLGNLIPTIKIEPKPVGWDDWKAFYNYDY